MMGLGCYRVPDDGTRLLQGASLSNFSEILHFARNEAAKYAI